MVDATRSTVAVTLSVTPELEERVVDWLLARSDVATFTSSAVYGHGADGGLSIAEQVSGRQRRVEVTIEVPADTLESWLQEIATAFASAHIPYRVMPVLRSGHLHAPVV